MSATGKRAVCLAMIIVAGGALQAGCSRENLVQPAPENSLAAEVSADGVVTLSRSGHDLVQHPGRMLVLDGEGRQLAHQEACFRQETCLATGRTWSDVYPGVGLQLGRSRGGLARLFRVDEPLQLPPGAATVEFVTTVNLSPGLLVITDQGVLATGQTVQVTGGFRLVGANGQVPFHMQAAVGWDALGRNRPWMAYRLTRQPDGTLRVGTTLPAAWFAEAGAGFPLSVMTSIVPEAPAPLLGAIFLAPTSPGASTLSLAATYANARLDSLEVAIDWGDGAVSTRVTNWPVQELHTYPGRRREVTILLQVSDFSVDEAAQLTPRTERRLFRMFGPPEDRPDRQRHADPLPQPGP